MPLPSIFPPKAFERSLKHFCDVRHTIHKTPELGMACHKTAALVATELRAMGADIVEEGIGQTGVVAVFNGQGKGRSIGLRADMDALPLSESTNLPWSSSIPGCMHACGHDGHTSALLMAADYFATHRDFCGRIVCIFQPGEEGYAGAQKMIDDGLFERFPVDEVYAIHGAPTYPVGDIAFSCGTMTAAADAFSIQILGEGGHGARPHQTIDPIVAAAQLVNAAQTIVSRSINPVHGSVVSFCSIHAGVACGNSIIPNSCELAGTVRTENESDRSLAKQRLQDICDGIALSTQSKIIFDYQRFYPPAINNARLAQSLGKTFSQLLGPDHVDTTPEGSMGGEDFAFMLQSVPGLYIRVGTGDETHQASLHNPQMDFNDRALPIAAGVYVVVAMSRLSLPDNRSIA